MIEAHAPGKLFIVGEYAVVEAAEPAVLVAIDRFIRVRLTEFDTLHATILSPHMSAAVDVLEQLRAERGFAEQHYLLESTSELEDENGIKLGLGSSAAVTVATVEVIARLYGIALTQTERFKLALLATIAVSPKASGGDLAASTFGGWLRYTSPNRDLLAADRARHGVEGALKSEGWQSLEITQLPSPNHHRLLIGWTGSPASTESLVDQLNTSVIESGSLAELDHQRFLAASRSHVDAVCASLEKGNDAIAQEITSARRLLQSLAISRGIEIETETLRNLCEIAEAHGCAAKPSGAGGGDCGIVLARRNIDVQPLITQWQRHGIRPLDLQVHDVHQAAIGEPNG